MHVCIKRVRVLAFFVFSFLCEPLRACLHVVFELCRGGCLSLCICQSFGLDRQSTKPKRQGVGEETEKRMDENGSRERGGEVVVRGRL